MKAIININGQLCPPEEAKISIFDRGFLYGDSIYEVTLVQDGVPVKLDYHYDRLWQSAERLDMTIPFSREQLNQELKKGLKALGEPRAYVRLIITRGEGEMGLDPSLSSHYNLVIIYKQLPEYPKAWYQNGVEVIIAGVLRNPKESIDPAIKSGNYLNNVMAMTEARKQGAFDAIMLNAQGVVTEATTSNIWMVLNGVLYTPPLKAGILGGITRKALLEIAHQNDIKVLEQNIKPEELLSAEECFLSSSTREVVPVVKIDGKAVGTGRPGPISQKLHQIYQKNLQTEVLLAKSKWQ